MRVRAIGRGLAAAACAAILGSAAGATAQDAEVALHGPPAAAASLLAAERAFAARAASAGAAKAFAEYMDPTDSRSFDGGDPHRGAAAIAKSHADGGRLAWVPREVFASVGGDMGTTWGVWTFNLPGEAAPRATGRYVTVWRKDAAGAWKAIIDIGTPGSTGATRLTGPRAAGQVRRHADRDRLPGRARRSGA